MSRRYLPLLIAGIAAMLLPAGREARADQVGNFVKTRDLTFGQIIAGPGGSVTVSPGGVRTATGVIALNLPAATSAAFSATVVTVGNSNKGNIKTVIVSLPSSIQLTSGSNKMTVDTFVSSPVAGARSAVGLGSPPVTVSVGATLRVAPNQPPGKYSGSFTVTADFQ
jgi:hypothetical protein